MIIKEIIDGASIDATCTMYPTFIKVVADQEITLPADSLSTMYGYVYSGTTTIQGKYGKFELLEGGYFCVPVAPDLGATTLTVQGSMVLIQRFGFRGQLTTGMVEEKGRLTYIDGCSDTLLVYPPRLGDSCLNHLHFPSGIVQTVHCHPSIRAGIVARGKGTVYRTGATPKDNWSMPLEKGSIFLIEAQEAHAFRTDESGETMDVIAFHPDSDWGPTDGVHPMINRTYINLK